MVIFMRLAPKDDDTQRTSLSFVNKFSFHKRMLLMLCLFKVPENRQSQMFKDSRYVTAREDAF